MRASRRLTFVARRVTADGLSVLHVACTGGKACLMVGLLLLELLRVRVLRVRVLRVWVLRVRVLGVRVLRVLQIGRAHV